MMAMFGVSHVALYGVPLLLGNSRWRFAGGGECGRAWSCYLAPLGNCTLEAVARGNASNLARVVAGHGGVTAADACGERGRPRRGALDVARGMSYLHGRKPQPVIHRDLKPGNLMLTRANRLKIGDGNC